MDIKLDALSFDVHLDSLVGGIENISFDQNEISFDLLTTKSLENNALNEVVPEHIDTKITLELDTNIHKRETFWKLYFEAFYSL